MTAVESLGVVCSAMCVYVEHQTCPVIVERTASERQPPLCIQWRRKQLLRICTIKNNMVHLINFFSNTRFDVGEKSVKGEGCETTSIERSLAHDEFAAASTLFITQSERSSNPSETCNAMRHYRENIPLAL